MGPVKPISTLAARILGLLLSHGTPLDMLQIRIRIGGPYEELVAALAELQAAKLAEPRPRVTPANWQPVRA